MPYVVQQETLCGSYFWMGTSPDGSRFLNVYDTEEAAQEEIDDLTRPPDDGEDDWIPYEENEFGILHFTEEQIEKLKCQLDEDGYFIRQDKGD